MALRRPRRRGRDIDALLARMNAPVERADLAPIEERRKMLETSTELVGDSFEAVGRAHYAQVGSSSRTASSSLAKAGLLFRLAERLAPRRTVELGSAFGISGAYLVAGIQAAGGGEFCTIEAAASRSAIAGQTIAQVSAPLVDVDLRVGLFDDHLDALDGATLVFIDGNHFGEPTRKYVEESMTRGDADLVLVLDDVVGYSHEMDRVWDILRRDPRFDAHGGVGDVGVLARGRPASLLR